jgi:HrpA-like RNA helicase
VDVDVSLLSQMERREKLPAYQMKKRIVSAIEMNQVTIISGDTVNMKTTITPTITIPNNTQITLLA